MRPRILAITLGGLGFASILVVLALRFTGLQTPSVAPTPEVQSPSQASNPPASAGSKLESGFPDLSVGARVLAWAGDQALVLEERFADPNPSRIWSLDRRTGQWRLVVRTKLTHYLPEILSLPGGRVLLLGGREYYCTGSYDAEIPINQCEVVDLKTETSQTFQAPQEAHDEGTLLRLKDERWIWIGGQSWKGPDIRSSAEPDQKAEWTTGGTFSTAILDPVSLTWSPGPKLSVFRERPVCVELQDGRVAVWGGRNPAHDATGGGRPTHPDACLEILDLAAGTTVLIRLEGPVPKTLPIRDLPSPPVGAPAGGGSRESDTSRDRTWELGGGRRLVQQTYPRPGEPSVGIRRTTGGPVEPILLNGRTQQDWPATTGEHKNWICLPSPEGRSVLIPKGSPPTHGWVLSRSGLGADFLEFLPDSEVAGKPVEAARPSTPAIP